jgi:hypothetical protein
MPDSKNKMVGAGSCLNIAESILSGFLGNTTQARIWFISHLSFIIAVPSL